MVVYVYMTEYHTKYVDILHKISIKKFMFSQTSKHKIEHLSFIENVS